MPFSRKKQVKNPGCFCSSHGVLSLSSEAWETMCYRNETHVATASKTKRNSQRQDSGGLEKTVLTAVFYGLRRRFYLSSPCIRTHNSKFALRKGSSLNRSRASGPMENPKPKQFSVGFLRIETKLLLFMKMRGVALVGKGNAGASILVLSFQAFSVLGDLVIIRVSSDTRTTLSSSTKPAEEVPWCSWCTS